MERIRRDFTTLTIVLMAVGIAINIAVGQLNYAVLKLPVYLDSIGTILVGVLAGPWVGAATGLLANLIWGLTGLNVPYMPFMLVAAVIGMLAGFFGEAGWLRVWWKVILAGIITGVVASVISAPISAYVFGGVTGAGTDVLTAAFRSMGAGVLGASFEQGAVSDPIDKIATYILVWLILLALPKRFIALFPRAENVRGGSTEAK